MDDLLPHQIPALEGLDVAARREPSHEVGGDYYEFISLGDDRWGIAIADVVGKGIAAALLVAAMRASLASLASQELALRAILRRANRFFHDSVAIGSYVTLFYAVLDVRSRRLIYVNAGHMPPVLVRRDGSIELLEEGGLPLGLFPEPHYFEGIAKLGDGDLLALYTDGISDASRPGGEYYGRPRLHDLLARVREGSAVEICATVMQDVRRFSQSTVMDDETLVVIKAP